MAGLSTASDDSANAHAGEDAEHHKIANHGGHEEGEEGEGPWLMSFADMVTLLMCFFILFFSVDKGNMAVDSPEKMQDKLKAKMAKNPELATSGPDLAPVPFTGPNSPDAPKAKEISQELTDLLQRLDVVSMVNVLGPDIVEVVLLNVHFFVPGDAIGTEKATKAVHSLAKKLKSLPRGTAVEVEGHTDADRVVGKKYATNWELSTARASWVVRTLSEAGVDPRLLKAGGFAEFRPLAPEADERGFAILPNKALNRRIVIRLRLPTVDPAAVDWIKASEKSRAVPTKDKSEKQQEGRP
jgi:chemotaxis protein MotB